MAIDSWQLPFAEQIDFLKQKVNLPTKSYKDMTTQQHDRAFVVAGAMKADLLNDLHQAVNKATAEGKSAKWFQDNFMSIVAKNGWTDWTGEDSKEGRAWRARVIYQTNLRTSHAAGRYKQMTDPAVLKSRPYWRYRHNSTEHPRMSHQRLNNLVLPADDPFWKFHFPPNGYGCQCNVESINARELARMGKDKPDTAPDYDIDQAGFNNIPGATWHPDLDKYPHDMAKQYLSANMQDGVFDRWLDTIADDVKTDLSTSAYDDVKRIKGYSAQEDATKKLLRERVGNNEQYPISVLSPAQKALLGVETQVIQFSHYDAVKQAFSRDGNTGFDHTAYAKLQYLIDNAHAIIRQDGAMSVWIDTAPNMTYLAVLQQTKSGKGLFLKSYRLGSPNEIERAKKRGTVLFEK